MGIRRFAFCFFTFLLTLAALTSISARAQDVPAHSTALDEPSPEPTPNPSPTPEAKPAKQFLLDVLSDQKAIWVSPFRLKGGDAKWIAPLGVSTAILLGTDRNTAAELAEGGGHSTRLRWSRDISQMGTAYTAGGVAAAFYLYGRSAHNARARETGLLSAEALIDTGLVTEALKLASNRPRPLADNGRGDFFDGGNSFPSGHSTTAWTLATVVAMEYHDRPLVKWSAYGLATAVSISRYTGRNHFLSDVLVGSALGYGIGLFVYKTHHDRSLDGDSIKVSAPPKHSRLIPMIAPIYSRSAHAYGAQLNWPL
jgi:membrane-associated phospholipid phosphatase